jgi:succinate dehydrogenase hydrophobic anchor subunit
MKKLNILLIMLLSIVSIFAESGASDISKDYIRAAFWIFTLILSVGGLLLVINKRNELEEE